MPITPLHMGPGLLIKAPLRGHFSLLVFGWTQLVMDIQPLLVLLSGKEELHGITHSYLGALVLTGIAALTGRPLATYGLKILGRNDLLPLSWLVTLCSATIGAFSHVLLDSLMHADLAPFAPFSAANALRGLVAYDLLNLLCLGSGVLGLALWALSAWRKRTPD